MKRQLQSDEILKWVKKKAGTIRSSDLVGHFGMSRQTAARNLKEMVNQGFLTKIGSTRAATYVLPSKRGAPTHPKKLDLRKSLKGLAEDKVYDEVVLKLGLKKELSENTFGILYYAFSEMLNNAIDHSRSQSAKVTIEISLGYLKFSIADKGIGIFRNIKQGFRLKTNEEAVEHLLKGKQTTAPEAHTGQGVFFTSKIADRFEIRSSDLTLLFDNEKSDLVLSNSRLIKGTTVSFAIKVQSKKSLEKLFKQYANNDFEFDRTKYPIVLLRQSGTVSRSQARRLIVGLEKFDRIILDFSDVKQLGQGFADEIFRVFQSRYPNLVIEIRNASSAVDFMVRRARQVV